MPTLCASDGESIRQLALQGNGIALLSHFMIKRDLKKGALVEVLTGQVKSPNVREPVNAVYYRHSAVSSRIAVFLDFFSPKFDL
ncbi:LysR substrate-binding domain-containing protein [Marinomonas epiphytica]